MTVLNRKIMTTEKNVTLSIKGNKNEDNSIFLVANNTK